MRRRLAAILAAANPFGLFFGPTFQKEVRSAGRRRSTYWLRALYPLLLLGIVALTFSGMRDSLRGMGTLQRFQVLQSFAPYFTAVVAWFQFVAMALMAPILTSSCVCEEKRGRTLAALLTTPLTSGQIAGGKLSSRVVQLLILSLLSTPLLLAVRVFGGVSAELVLAAACISISTAVLGASLGLMYSIWHRRASTAAMFGLFSLVLVQGAPVTVASLVCLRLQESGAVVEFPSGVLASCSPAALANAYLGAFGSPPFPGTDPTGMWIINSIYNLLIAGSVTLFASVMLRRTMMREAAGDPARAAGKRRAARSADATPTAASPGSIPPPPPDEPGLVDDGSFRQADRTREVGDRPVLWREVRLPTFGSRRTFRISVGLTIALLLLLYAWVGVTSEGLQGTVAVIGVLVVMAQSVFLTTGGISQERDARTWDVLLCTPLSGRDIVLGKFLGTLRGQWFVPAVVLGHFVIAVVFGAVHPAMLLHAAIILLGPMSLFSALGVFLGLVFRRGMTASVVNLSAALLLWIGTWVLAALFAWFFNLEVKDWYDGVWRACFVINPVSMMIAASEGTFLEHGIGAFRGGLIFHVYQTPLRLGAFTAVIAGVCAGYLAAAAACLYAATRWFTRLSGRAS